MRKVALEVVRNLRHGLATRRRARSLRLLENRWDSHKSVAKLNPTSRETKSAFARITTRVINLDRRGDRLHKVSSSLAYVGVNKWERIPGVEGNVLYPEVGRELAGSIGCQISHIAAIARGLSPGAEAIMICEDDLEFLGSPALIRSLVAEFLEDPRLDVLSLSGRPRGGSIPISDNLRVVIGLVGRGCYLIKPHMISPLIEVFSDGLKKLNRGNLNGKGDLEWRPVQTSKFFFAFPRQDVAQQSAGFSDIEGKHLGPR
jgi:hypothetical protein